MKRTKSVVFVMLLLTFMVFPCIKQSAVGATTDDTGKSSWNPVTTSTSDVYGMNYLNVLGNTVTSGLVSNQHLSVLEMKTDGINSKLVNWAIQTTGDRYARAGLSAIAADYEKNHPGWIVVGGINADQYYTSHGSGRGTDGTFYYSPQPYYPLIMDGERRFAYNPYSSSDNMVGFTNDGLAESFVYDTAIKGFYVYVLDENDNVINKYPVSGFNEAVQDNETVVWSSYISTSANLVLSVNVPGADKNIFLVENADLSYMSNNKVYGAGYVDAFFGRGTISKNASSATVGRYQFAVQTENAELKNDLDVGTKVIVQAEYVSDKMNEVEAAAGYHSVQRLNNVDNTGSVATNAYNSKQYNRSLFGRKADGTYVLITADKRGSGNDTIYGLNFTEINAVLKHYGVVDGFQDDGGGSVTAIVRNAMGTFDIVNESSDSGVKERSILNGLFFVVRDPGIRVTNQTRTSFDVVQTTTPFSNNVSNINIEMGGVKQGLTTGGITFSGLTESTDYQFAVSYQLTIDGKTVDVSYNMTARTSDFVLPPSGLRVESFTHTSIKIVKDPLETYSWIRNVRIYVDETMYIMSNVASEYVVSGLTKGETYKVRFEYDVIEPGNPTVYSGSDPEIKVKLLSFDMPEIISFTEESIQGVVITFNYSYSDPDDAVKSAYIYVNEDEKIPLTEKSGTVSYNSFNRKNSDYQFQLVIEYHHSAVVYKVTSETLKYTKIESEGGCNFGSQALTIVVTLSLGVVILKRKSD